MKSFFKKVLDKIYTVLSYMLAFMLGMLTMLGLAIYAIVLKLI